MCHDLTSSILSSLHPHVPKRNENMMESLNKRRTFLINPRFQLTFLGFMFLISILVILSVYFANLYFFWKFNEIGISLQLKQDHVFFNFLKKQKVIMNWIFFFLSFGLFFILSAIGLLFSHQIAGPIYRIQKHLLRTKETKVFSKIKFRKRDFFQELAEAYNQHLPDELEKDSKKDKS